MLQLQYSPLEIAARQAIDTEVHRAVTETCKVAKGVPFTEDDLQRTAKVACYNALEWFKTFVNNELRLIEAEREQRIQLQKLSIYPPEIFKDK